MSEVRESSESTRRPRKRVQALAALPSLLTIGNGICGFASVLLFLKAYAYLQLGDNVAAGDRLYWATGLMALGMLFDVLDGRVARMTGSDSQFGANLDSLCDAITFCLAPAILIRVFGEALVGPALGEDTTIAVRAVWTAAALYLACGLLRLARFNVETGEDDDHSEFSGLPTPAACGAVVSIFFIARFSGVPENAEYGAADFIIWLLPIASACFALLMISRVRYGHAINKLVKGPKTIPQFVVILGVVGAAFIFVGQRFELVFAALMLLYIVYGFMLWLWDRFVVRSSQATLFALPLDDDEETKIVVEEDPAAEKHEA